jgi:hypothetical protein
VDDGIDTIQSYAIAPDDIVKGGYYTVLKLKHTRSPIPLMGQAFECLAVNLPFLIGRLVIDNTVATLDIRYLEFMKVSPDFVEAQRAAVAVDEDNITLARISEAA